MQIENENYIQNGRRSPEKSPQNTLVTQSDYFTKSDLQALSRQIASLTSYSRRKSVNVKEAALMMGVCEESVRRLVRRKLLKKSNAFRTILIPIDEIDTFLGATKSV